MNVSTEKTESTGVCPCGSGLAYKECCGLLHSGATLALTAEELMRSRFAAYALRDGTYLRNTWDPSKRPARIDFSKEDVEWTCLEIVSRKKGAETDTKGIVEFKAYYRSDGQAHVIQEISRFRKIENRWFYLDGTVKSTDKVGEPTNQGPSTPCPCGSGKKTKRCCGAD